MWNISIHGVDFYHIANWFFLYSFLGWVWETAYVSVRKGKYVNRGFINGPLCTIYGFGALSVYLILKPVEESLLLIFAGGMVVATLLEYVTAVLMENIFHTSWWDYSDQKFNFQGRICLGVSLGWGVFSVALFRIIHPVVSGIVEWYPVWAGKIGVCIAAAAYMADFLTSAAAAFRLEEKLPAWEQTLEELQGELLVKASKRISDWADSRGMSLEHLHGHRERLEDIEFLKELDQKRNALKLEIAMELEMRKEAMTARFGHNIRRFVKSYPNLNRGYRLHKEKKEKSSKTKK